MRHIVIVGAPGTGKSTIARGLAEALGIVQLIGTDTIREIMRTCLPKEKYPLLHSSAIVATDPDSGPDKEIWGFREQASLVIPGVEAVLRRATKEGSDVIIEGIHPLPGRILSAGVLHVVLTVPDHEKHLAQMLGQGQERSSYKVEHVDRARAFQAFLIAEAKKYGLPCIENRSVEGVVGEIVGLVRGGG